MIRYGSGGMMVETFPKKRNTITPLSGKKSCSPSLSIRNFRGKRSSTSSSPLEDHTHIANLFLSGWRNEKNDKTSNKYDILLKSCFWPSSNLGAIQFLPHENDLIPPGCFSMVCLRDAPCRVVPLKKTRSFSQKTSNRFDTQCIKIPFSPTEREFSARLFPKRSAADKGRWHRGKRPNANCDTISFPLVLRSLVQRRKPFQKKRRIFDFYHWSARIGNKAFRKCQKSCLTWWTCYQSLSSPVSTCPDSAGNRRSGQHHKTR